MRASSSARAVLRAVILWGFQRYRLVQELALRWIDLDLTVGEGIKQLGTELLLPAEKKWCSRRDRHRPAGRSRLVGG